MPDIFHCDRRRGLGLPIYALPYDHVLHDIPDPFGVGAVTAAELQGTGIYRAIVGGEENQLYFFFERAGLEPALGDNFLSIGVVPVARVNEQTLANAIKSVLFNAASQNNQLAVSELGAAATTAPNESQIREAIESATMGTTPGSFEPNLVDAVVEAVLSVLTSQDEAPGYQFIQSATPLTVDVRAPEGVDLGLKQYRTVNSAGHYLDPFSAEFTFVDPAAMADPAPYTAPFPPSVDPFGDGVIRHTLAFALLPSDSYYIEVVTNEPIGQYEARSPLITTNVTAQTISVGPAGGIAIDQVVDAAIGQRLPDGVSRIAGAGAEAATLDEVMGGGGVSSPVLQFDIEDDFVFQVHSRRSGLLAAQQPIYLAAKTERPRFAFDVRPITEAKPLKILSIRVEDEQHNESTALTVSTDEASGDVGVRDFLVMSRVTGCEAAGLYGVRIKFRTTDSSELEVVGCIICP